jgi:hypothetical protein
MTRSRILAAVFALAPSAAWSQTPTKLASYYEFPAELSSIAGVRELGDGRVIVLDRREKKILLLAHNQQPKTIGREGSGPGEFLRPTALIAAGGDSTLVEDGQNNRFLVLGAAGRLLGELPLVTLRPQEGVSYTLTPRGTDRRGRWYFQTPVGLAGGERIPILRYDRATGKFDSVATIRNDRFGAQRGRPASSAGGASFGAIVATPWTTKDEWVVSADGDVIVARNEPYTVDWISPSGQMTHNAPIAYRRVKVGEAERETWRERQRLGGGATLRTTDASGKTVTRQLPVPEPETWPEVLPAFSGQGAVLAAPDGRVWIQRLDAASVKSVNYDVIDKRGVVAQRVELPLSHRVIGFGKDAVYVIREDEDGLQYLRRYTPVSRGRE